ncbi:MAG: hypothetical protein MUP27_01115 [Desulfobacterales bacterium]|nr:hypothetical protein [Desulfobacterales bacterium]
MDLLLGDISHLIFKIAVISEGEEFTLDRQMFRVISELDGKKTIGTIAQNMGIDVKTMREIIRRLLDLEVIAPADGTIPMLKEEFFGYLTDQLSLAIGPMAEVLVEDEVATLGYDRSRFPIHRAEELIDLLAQKIYREEKRSIFKQNLIKKILNKEG